MQSRCDMDWYDATSGRTVFRVYVQFSFLTCGLPIYVGFVRTSFVIASPLTKITFFQMLFVDCPLDFYGDASAADTSKCGNGCERDFTCTSDSSVTFKSTCQADASWSVASKSRLHIFQKLRSQALWKVVAFVNIRWNFIIPHWQIFCLYGVFMCNIRLVVCMT